MIPIAFRSALEEKCMFFRKFHKLKKLEFIIDAGVRPDGQGPFVAAKGPKTNDTQFDPI